MSSQDADVIIAGAGIAGATLALALRQAGLKPILIDPVVFDAHVSVTVGATDTMRRLYLAQFWVHGAKLRDDVSFDEYMGTMRAVIVGTQRLVSSQRALATEVSRHRGELEPVAGLAANLVARSMVQRI